MMFKRSFMKDFYFILIFIIAFQRLCFSQEDLSKDYSIEFKKAREVSTSFNLNSTTRSRDDRLAKIMVKCKVKALDKKPVDSNGFSLVDTVNKLRYRFVEYGGYLPITIFVPNERTNRVLKEKILNENGEEYKSIPDYDPDVYDSFEDYSISGYKNVEIPINFGNKRNPRKSVTYYTPTPFKKFTATMYFLVIMDQKEPNFELYYHDQKIDNFEIDFK